MPDESAPPPLSVVILGTDAVLAAAPATPVQLAHACLAAGFGAVVPASWGDELIATECLRRATARGRDPVVCAVCPRVTERLLASGGELAQFAIALVSPPVATARYLRALCGDDRVRITFIGACPGADDDSIDDRVVPGEFLAQLAERGVELLEQPQVFDSVIPPDRRRFQSLPGGVPTPEALWGAGGRTLIEIDDDDYVTELAQRLISRENALLDIAPKLGCACSGALPDVAPRSSRIAAAAVEPPRSAMPVVDTTVQVDLVRSLPAAPRRREVTAPSPVERPSPVPAPPARQAPAGDTPITRSTPQAPPRRRVSTPEGMAAIDPAAPRRRGGGTSAPGRTVAGSVPTVNSGEGRALPRAYVARRRTGRTPPDNEAIRPGATRPAGAERERPIEASVEPARSVASAPRSAPSMSARSEAWIATTRATIDRIVRERMRLAVLIGIVIIASMLLGVMADRLFLGSAAESPRSAEAAQDDTVSGARALIGDSPASRTVERGGAVGPELVPRPSAGARRGAASVTPRRAVPDEGRAPAAGQPATPALPAPAPAPADSGARQSAPPAAATPPQTRQDSIDRELRAIARELELRRARLDSIARRDSLGGRPLR